VTTSLLRFFPRRRPFWFPSLLFCSAPRPLSFLFAYRLFNLPPYRFLFLAFLLFVSPLFFLVVFAHPFTAAAPTPSLRFLPAFSAPFVPPVVALLFLFLWLDLCFFCVLFLYVRFRVVGGWGFWVFFLFYDGDFIFFFSRLFGTVRPPACVFQGSPPPGSPFFRAAWR